MRKAKAVSDEILIASYNSKNRTVSNERLTQVFADVGKKYGYTDVDAKFYQFSDFKVSWTRTLNYVDFQVSDYLDRAPDDVLSSVAEHIFERISGNPAEFSDLFIRYINDPKIISSNRVDFLRRRKSLNADCVGQYHDLNDCVNRLRDQGLIPPDMECVLCWDSKDAKKAAGCSVLQRVVWVNDVLDQKGVPESVLDYAVYTMMAHLIAGPGLPALDQHKRLDSLYPLRDEAIAWLNRNGLRI